MDQLEITKVEQTVVELSLADLDRVGGGVEMAEVAVTLVGVAI